MIYGGADMSNILMDVGLNTGKKTYGGALTVLVVRKAKFDPRHTIGYDGCCYMSKFLCRNPQYSYGMLDLVEF